MGESMLVPFVEESQEREPGVFRILYPPWRCGRIVLASRRNLMGNIVSRSLGLLSRLSGAFGCFKKARYCAIIYYIIFHLILFHIYEKKLAHFLLFVERSTPRPSPLNFFILMCDEINHANMHNFSFKNYTDQETERMQYLNKKKRNFPKVSRKCLRRRFENNSTEYVIRHEGWRDIFESKISKTRGSGRTPSASHSGEGKEGKGRKGESKVAVTRRTSATAEGC